MKVTITGASGRMGKMLLDAVLANEDAKLHGATLREGDNRIGCDAASLINYPQATDVILSDNPAEPIAGSDVVIDFTPPDAALNHARICASGNIAYVSGTTGFTDEQLKKLEFCYQHIPVLRAANFSLGVNWLVQLAKQTAQNLPPDYDIEILEMHHNQKRDAPSGTALALAESCASGRNLKQDEAVMPPYHGTDAKREAGKIGMAVMRGGTVTGEHQVIFAGADEVLILEHRAHSRKIFAQGALHAALWLYQKPAGLYSMQDIFRDET